MKEMVLDPEKWGLDLDVAKRVLDKGANFSVEFLSGDIGLEALGTAPIPDWMKMAGIVPVSYTHLIKVENKSFLNFYSTLFTLGVNEVVFVEKDKTKPFDLEEIVKKPDFSQLPENQRPLFNPQLQLTGIYFMQEFRRGVDMSEKTSINELEEEMAANLVKSKFLVAVEKQEEGQENVQVPYIKNKNGDVFLSLIHI